MKKSTKTAAAIFCWLQDVPYEHAKQMTAEQFLSLYEWDHYPIPRAEGGSDHFTNLVPLLRSDHRKKTAKLDVPRIAKNKRVGSKHQAHLERMKQKGK